MARGKRVSEPERPRFSGFAGSSLPFEDTPDFHKLVEANDLSLEDARELIRLVMVRHNTSSLGLSDDVEALVKRLAQGSK